MAEKTEVELALSSISWHLKRIADSLEEIEDTLKPAPSLKTAIHTPINSNKIKDMIANLKSQTEEK